MRGLKFSWPNPESPGRGRIPHGMRGLKSVLNRREASKRQSHPAWDAWIEIWSSEKKPKYTESHPACDAWIEM